MLDNQGQDGLTGSGRVVYRQAHGRIGLAQVGRPRLGGQGGREAVRQRQAVAGHFQQQNVGGVAGQQGIPCFHGNQFPIMDDADGVADPFHIAQNMAGEEDGDLAAQFGDQLEHIIPASRIQGAGRFIQQQDRRPMDERLGNAQALLHTAGEAANGPFCRFL